MPTTTTTIGKQGAAARERVICLIDMDCFYVQVEELAAPEFRGRPCGVAQYNPYQGGGLIAVNYEARKFGVKRGMRGEQAKALCPDFHTFFVNEKRGKADLSKYREASAKIFDIIVSHCSAVEKASIDEAYVDLTDRVLELVRSRQIARIDPASDLSDSFVVGSFTLPSTTSSDEPVDRAENLAAWLQGFEDRLDEESPEALLAVGGVLVQRLRHDIERTLGYRCSAGVAHNKTLAKLCCGLNKPNKQTLLPLRSLETLYAATPIQKVKNLGGKLGVVLVEEMGLRSMLELARLGLGELTRQFGEKTGAWLHQISRGVDLEPVMARQAAKSVGCSKNFRGNQALRTAAQVAHWTGQLCEELEERLEHEKTVNNREPGLLVVHVTNEAGSFSKQAALVAKPTAKRMAEQAAELLAPFNKAGGRKELWSPAVFTLGISTTKFKEIGEEKTVKGFLNKYFSNAPTGTSSEPKSDSSATPGTSTAQDDEPKSCQSDDTSANVSLETLERIGALEDSPPVRPKESVEKQPEKQEKQSVAKKSAPAAAQATKLTDFIAKTAAESRQIYEDVDYVRCGKCSRKVLCWEMAEHEDYHFAQELAREISAPAPRPQQPQAAAAAPEAKKRSIEGGKATAPASKKAKPTVTLDRFFHK